MINDKTQAAAGSSALAGSALNPDLIEWLLLMKMKAVNQKEKHTHLQIFWQKLRPPGFPKGEFVASYDNGTAYAVDCNEIIDWIDSVLKPNA